MISISSEDDLVKFLSDNICKIKTPLRKPPVQKKLAILRRIFGDAITEDLYISAAKKAGFSYTICHSRHYVDDSSSSWGKIEKFADWIKEHGDVPKTKLVNLEEVISITGLTKTQIDEKENSGEFPKRVRISRKLSYWHIDEVDRWLAR